MLVELLVLVIILGIVLYVLRMWFPIDPFLYKIAVTIAALIVVLWLLDAFGVGGGPHLRILR